MIPPPWAHPAAQVLCDIDWQPGLFIPLAILAIIIVAIAGWHAAAKRRAELRQWATAHSLHFNPSKHCHLDSEFPDFRCLHQGHSRYAHNVAHGHWDQRPILAFDYHYVTGHGRDRQTHQFSAVIVESDVLLQPLLIRPENLFDKMSAFFGHEDINFESAEFSRRFFVKAPNKRWAYDVIHARTMEFLMANPPFSIQFEPRCAICYRDRHFKPADFDAACQVTAGLLDRLPDYLVRQQGGRRPQGDA